MNLEFIFVFIFSISTILIHQYFRKKFTTIYFSLRQLIVSDSNDISIKGVILTFLPTFIFSFLLSFIFANHYRVVVLAYSFLTSFLIIWPSILYPKDLLSSELYKKRKALYIIYFIYILFNLGVSILAINLYNVINKKNLFVIDYYSEFMDKYVTMHTFYQNVIANVIVTIGLLLLGKLWNYVSKKIRGIK